jgi:CubicO group peptidase (beta-lactamase class C family)
MLVQPGETPAGRLLWPDTVKLMTTNRLTPAQRQLPVFGMPLFAARGFGLGVSVVTDEKLNAAMGAGAVGAFGWPGGFGGWWQADPANDMVLIWLQACVPPPPPQGGNMPMRMPGARSVVEFQKTAYAVSSCWTGVRSDHHISKGTPQRPTARLGVRHERTFDSLRELDLSAPV